MQYRNIWILCTALAATGLHSAHAAPPVVEFSGFLSVVGGKVLNGSLHGPMADNVDLICPCYIADFANFGTYGGTWSMVAETRAGLQAVATLSPQLSLTAQLTARATDARAQLQWAYATYHLGPNWDLQVGRKRIPLYFYSDFQDVGVTYPWAGLPPELYGWEATNYNGVSLRNRTRLGDFYSTTSVFAGSERVSDSRYMLPYGQRNTEVRWNNLLGVDMELSRGGVTLRGVAMRADTVFTDKDQVANDASEHLRAFGLAANFDFGSWFVLTEVANNIRTNTAGGLTGVTISLPAVSMGVGWRRGAWTSFLNYSQYQERSSDTEAYPNTEYRHTSLTVKYELSPRSTIKAQLDRYWEPAGPAYTGAADVLRLSYDRTF